MWNNPNKCVITCVPGNKSEAAETIDALIPRLKHEYGTDVLKFFHLDTVQDSMQIQWDPELRVATSPDDIAFLEGNSKDDDDYNFVSI